MMKKLLLISLLAVMSATLSSCKNGMGEFHGSFSSQASGWTPRAVSPGGLMKVASRVESAADKLFSRPYSRFKQINANNKSELHSCDVNNTAIITIFSVNGQAQSEIDVTLDSNPVGNLTTYFANDGPPCKTPSTEGIITLMVPVGDHVIEASSPNYYWPGHPFTVEKCECRLIPLS